MPPLPEYLYRVRRYYRFHPQEIKALAISILVIAFVWGLDDKQPTFVAAHWTANMVQVFIIVLLAFFVHISGQKLLGLWHGYRVEYYMWPTGLLSSLILGIISLGKLTIMLPGGLQIHHLSKQRIGEFRYGINAFQSAIVAGAGPIANVLFAMFGKTVQLILGIGSSPFIDHLYIFNLVFAVFMLLPLPNLPGMMMFWGSRLAYVFFFGAILSYILLVYLFSVYSLIWAIVLGAVIWGLYSWFVESGS